MLIVAVCLWGTATAASTATASVVDSMALARGLEYFEEERYELARVQLTQSAKSEDTYVRAESYLYLNALEMELGNYDAAAPYLERYHAESMLLLKQAADLRREMDEQVVRMKRRQAVAVGVVVLVALGAVGFVRRRRGSGAAAGSGASLAGSGSGTRFDEASWRHYLVDAEVFKQTPVWAEITELAGQEAGRGAKVMSLARQEALDRELARAFAGYGERLREECPALTAGDVKLCCLSLLPLSSFGRALCYGSTETNIIKQRKHQIKKKLATARNGHELFEFIFSGR